MQTIMITRHYSGFEGVEDHFEIGNHEHDGNAAASEYLIPAGYSVQYGRLYDPAGIEAAIVLGPHGGPVAISRLGDCPDVALTRINQ